MTFKLPATKNGAPSSIGLLRNASAIVGVESIIDDPLGRIQFVVVLEAQVPKAFSDSFQSRAFGLIAKRIVSISSINNSTEQYGS